MLLVCGIKRFINTEDGTISVVKPIAVAGEYRLSHGGALDPKWSRLKSSDSAADREKEGLRLSMEGGIKPEKQKAIVEFLCPPKDEGKRRIRRDKHEKDEKDDKDEKHEKDGKDDKDEDEDEDDDTATGEEVDDGAGGRLKYISYQEVKDTWVLTLEWTTKYACEDAHDKDRENKASSGHWGFFTWLIIM